MELKGFLTINEFGKYGGASQAAKFFWSRQKRKTIDQATPYLELCFDPDPEALCTIVEDGQIFGKVLEKYPDLLGKAASIFNNKLPFTIKVVSLGKILPLVFHPSKSDAEELYKAMPHRYNDGEAKSKMVVALRLFEMFYGFRSKENIKSVLMSVPELSVLIPQWKQEDFFQKLLDEPLREVIYSWLSAPPARMKLSLDMFFARMEKQGLDAQLEHNTGLIRRLQAQCPHDPGVYAPFFLNHYTIDPGRAVHVQAGVPYSFLSGDCVEVSSRGLARVVLALSEGADVQLCRGVRQLALVSTPAEDQLFPPIRLSPNTVSYRPPTKEFAVDRVQVRSGQTFRLPGRDSGWVLLVTRGKADCRIRPSRYAERTLCKGSAVYILPHQELSFAASQDLMLLLVYPNTQYSSHV